jgi:DNA-binding CsgD family transcriptional regulator
LTLAERRVLRTVAQGLGPQDAADELGVTLATVRTHLQNLFAKTGTARQADLLRLLMTATPPVKRG